MKKIVCLFVCLFVGSVNAALLTEDFEGGFPAWESGWLGTNSNLQNIYGIGQGRGNNPDGLWLDDGDGNRGNDTVEILFNSTFGSTLSQISFDLTTYVSGVSFDIFDMSGTSIFNSVLSVTRGAYTDPGTYESFSVSSANGIKGFSLYTTGSQIEGSTSIDNVSVTTGAVSVPEPASLALLALGLAGIGFSRKKKIA